MSRARTAAVLFALAVALASAACYPKTGEAPGPLSPAKVKDATSRWPDVNEAGLTEGRALFVARCNQCHGHPDVTLVADDKWPGILERMGKNAKLGAEQTQRVLRFVLAARLP